MFENPIFWIVVGALLVGGWMYLSKGPLANVLRSKAKAKEMELAQALDDANSRVSSAQSRTSEKLMNGEKGKILVKGARKRIEKKYLAAQAAVQKYDLAAQAAAMANRPDLVARATKKLTAARETLAGLEPAYKKLVSSETQVVSAVQTLKERKEALKVDKEVIKGRSVAATTSMDANQLLAGLSTDGTTEDLERAYEILEDAESQAEAWQEMADDNQKDDDLDAELEALASGINSDDDTVARYMAEYGPQTKTE